MTGLFRNNTRAALMAGGALAAITALVAGVVLLLSSGGGERAEPQTQSGENLGLVLEPTLTGQEGIDAGTHFRLTSNVDISSDLVRSSLRVAPGVEVDVSENSAREFDVAPREALQQGVVYRFTFGEEGAPLQGSWAFQVRSPLRVVSTLPADKSSGVQLDTGIELTFSHDGVQNVEALVEITPAVQGHWEQHKRTFVFVPRELQRGTLYTVHLKPGVTVPNTDLKLDSDLSFSFETGVDVRGATPLVFDFLHKIGESSPKEPAFLTIYTSDQGLTSLPIDVFAYPSIDAFQTDIQQREDIPYWARFTRDRKTVDTTALSKVMTFDTQIEGRRPPSQPYFSPLTNQLYIRFPEALPQGYYLVQTTYQNTPVQAWLQVTDVATYMAVSETSTLVWVNDVGSGRPIAGATVRINGQTDAGKTDAQGVLEFDTPDAVVTSSTDQYNYQRQDTSGFLTVTDPAGRVALVPISPVISPAFGRGDGSFIEGTRYYTGYNYWNFATTDRPIYQPDDTVRFWGVALPREGAPQVQLSAQLVGYPSGGGGQALYQDKVEFKTTDLGTFTAEYPLKDAEEGYHTMLINGPDGLVTSVSFQVARYVKPAYKIDVTPSKPAVFAGETVDVTVKATFFDGTPLPGLKLAYREANVGGITTGPDGSASFSFVARDQGYVEALPINVVPAGPEEGEIAGEGAVVVFSSALLLTTDRSSYSDGNITISGKATAVDPALYSAGANIYPYPGAPKPSYEAGPAAGKTVTARITERISDAIEVGEAYDFVNKISRKVYRYDSHQGATFSVSATTAADGSFALQFPAAPLTSFEIELTAPDDRGRTGVYHIFAQASSATYDVGGVASISTPSNASAFFGSPESLELGDKVTAIFRRGTSEPPSGGDNRYLFYEGQRGIRHHAVQDNPRYEVTFTDRHIPSAVIGGVYFNGVTYIEAQYGPTLTFDPQSRALDIEVKSQKESYEPGDEATVEVSVRDAAGHPVQAEVNLSTVDEAVFAVTSFYSYQQEILARLYSPVPSGIIRTYASHQYPPELLEAGGRGGDGGARTDFRDLADFRSVRTNADGKATVSFKVPDNLTSWRVTAYAVTKDLKAGHGSGSIVVSLPFSVDVGINADYLESDSPQVRLRAFGSALKDGDVVEFTVSLPDLGAGDISASGTAFTDTLVSLPKLTAGSHKVTVKAKSGQSEDAVILPFEVVASRTEVAQVKLYNQVDGGTRFEAGQGRSSVTFMDAGRGQYYSLLASLRWAYGDRVDQALARTLAGRMLADYFGEDARPPAFEASPYLKAGTVYPPRPNARKPGVAILPFADSDLATTARVANLAPDLFGASTLRSALRAVVDDPEETPERTAIALYGLAGLGDPVLLDVTQLQRDPDLGWRGRLYAGLALQAKGDYAGASAVLDAVTKDFGEDTAPWYRLRVGEDDEDSMEATALAAILAAGIGDSRAGAMLRYVRENCSNEHLLYLDELQYLKGALPLTAAESVELSFSAGGESHKVSLEKGRTATVSLTSDELKALRVTVEEGAAAVAVRSTAPLAAQQAPSPDLKVTRTVRAAGQTATTSLPAAGVIEVTLQVSFGAQAPDGCYQVTDVLPSGLKVVTRPGYVSVFEAPPFFKPGVIFPYVVDGQRISFCVSKTQPSVIYYARASGRGDFTWEPAVVQNMRAPGLLAFSDPMRVTVK